MSFSLAIAGKGGSGKTTTSALIVRYLLRHNLTPVLAVDADGNANLHESLGITPGRTIGQILAEFNGEKITIPPGMTKGAYLELRLNEAVAESRGVDLLTMGRGEGAGCYCYPNTVLKEFISKLRGNYPFLVMDNEAGMEHLSRGTSEHIDILLLASDYSIKGVRTLGRIKELVAELKLDVKQVLAILTRVPPGGLDSRIGTELAALGLVPFALIPQDEAVLEFHLAKRSLLDLPAGAPAVRKVEEMMDAILVKNKPQESKT
jgi:CO dehydrogenase maturation factor